MRIGLLFPSIYASPGLFPDKIFAPRELLTDLSNGLVAKGHEVTVFSVPDVDTKARVVGTPTDGIESPLPYYKFRGADGVHRPVLDLEFAKHRFELSCVVSAFQAAKHGDLDILHVYHDSSLFFSHYLHETVDTIPVVYTLHDPLPPPDSFEYREFMRFARHNYVSISDAFRHSSLPMNFVATCYHGIDLSSYPFNNAPGDSYLFLGRLVHEKGLHHALAAVKKAGGQLTASINIPDSGEKNSYYDSIKDDLQRDYCTVLPVLDKTHRIELYGMAKALLFPIEWEEPFGVVLIEAMACGTPVIAYNRGSVPEIVKDGVTGFIVEPETGIEGLVEAMGKIQQIDRSACRAHVEEHFSVGMMTAGYEKIYRNL